MKNEKFDQFVKYALETKAMKRIQGGLCGCKAAAPYACEAGGYRVGTVDFGNCMGGVYADCEALVAECNIP